MCNKIDKKLSIFKNLQKEIEISKQALNRKSNEIKKILLKIQSWKQDKKFVFTRKLLEYEEKANLAFSMVKNNLTYANFSGCFLVCVEAKLQNWSLTRFKKELRKYDKHFISYLKTGNHPRMKDTFFQECLLKLSENTQLFEFVSNLAKSKL